jgi:RNA polymerase sigma-70 factor (ECF subfamily)
VLVAKAQGGDRIALRELIDQHKDRLFAFIWRMVRDHHEAEDVCQEAFLKAFGSLSTFSSEYRFSTWLFTIGYRVCLNRMRRKKIFTGEVDLSVMADSGASGAAEAFESDEAGRVRSVIWSAVDRLSPPQRATVLLFYRNELGCHEIARVLQVPVATVKSHLHRARTKLKEMLEGASEQEWQTLCNFSQRTG